MALYGTGLFVAGGEVVSTAGPGGALVAYGLIGIMVYFPHDIPLGKWRRTLPIPGSFGTYAKRYVDPAFGFAFWVGTTGLTGLLHWLLKF